ncbi:MAG: MFS transporter [Gammaproteobacteria bacterium]
MINDSEKPPKSIWALAAALACVGAGQSTVFILIPSEVRNLGFTEFEVGLIFSISALAWMFFSPFWGRLSDKFGRGSIFLIGMLGFALSMGSFAAILISAQNLLLPLALVFPLLVFTRLINGLLGSAVRPAAGGRIADLTSPTTRSAGFARFDAGWQFGVVIGPVVVGVLLSLFNENLLAPFIFIALLGALIGFYNFKDMQGPIEPLDEETKTKLQFTDSRVWPSLLIASFVGMANACLVLTVALYTKDEIITNGESVYSVVAIGFSIVALSGMFANLFIVDKFQIRPLNLIKWGCSIVLLSYLFLSQATSISSLYLALIMYGIGSGLVRPGNITILSLSVSKNEQGAASGWMGTVFPIGHLITPFTIMPLYMMSPNFPYFLISFLALLLIIFILLNQKKYFNY